MVHQHRLGMGLLQQKKGDAVEAQAPDEGHVKELHRRLADYACHHRKSSSSSHHALLLRLLLSAFCLVSCVLLLFPTRLFSEEGLATRQEEGLPAPCAAVADNTICCDRTAFRTDVCVMRGDVRTAAASGSLFLLVPGNETGLAAAADERIRPYTRKWETSVMSTVDELRLRVAPAGSGGSAALACEVRHDAPAVVFSTGGYTGNVYHEFNDGVIPLYITSRHYDKKVVFVMLEYHDWWMTKYGHIVSQLSNYPPIDFANDRRTHCFPEAVVGLRIHNELAIDAARTPGNRSIGDFRLMLDDAYRGRIRTIMEEEKQAAAKKQQRRGKKHRHAKPAALDEKPRLVIVSRNGSRAIENEGELTRAAAAAGFRVAVLLPRRDTELAKMYRALNASDIMVGVHGAAMTHFLFMRPGSVFIQVVPLGTDWAAKTYYGEPARRLGLRYMPYKILPRESSLYAKYGESDPVLANPDTVNAKGWQVTKKVYLDGQNVRLDMARFRRWLREAYDHWASQRRRTTDLSTKQRRSL